MEEQEVILLGKTITEDQVMLFLVKKVMIPIKKDGKDLPIPDVINWKGRAFIKTKGSYVEGTMQIINTD